ncbi:MAG: integrase [Oceanicaulis sp.]|uniref:tyrosine-type recombinase/integrase n=1 Tax=unclassified Oceanicaulis TaxID=2632123 RepID=UPI000C37B219|nr:MULTISPECIES: site-specific integrase [unclassified Oceanicaulis]MBC37685.1 integrase [Oceanicaulis sp.]
MSKITKRSVEALPPKETDYFVWDALIPGFGVRVSPKGRKTYTVQYRSGGRTKRVSLGVHGAVTAEQARDLARQTLGHVASGGDPSGDRRRERRAPDMAALCDRFLDEYVPVHLKPSTQREYHRCCEIFIKPKLGAMKVQDIKRPDIAALHHGLRDKPYQANRVLGVLSKLFNLAEVWGLREDGTNPTRHVQKYKEHKRERYLDPDEIERLFAVLDACVANGEETLHVAAAFKLLLLTGCRLSEIQKAKWSWVRGNVLVLPDAKTGPRRVLLSRSTVELLSALPRLPDNPYIIIGHIEGQHVTDLQKPWRRIRKLAGIEDVRIHDLRHTYASIAAAAGHSLPIIGKLLGHTQAQTTARYAHLAEAVTRNAADDVDDMIGGFVGQPQTLANQENVVPLSPQTRK